MAPRTAERPLRMVNTSTGLGRVCFISGSGSGWGLGATAAKMFASEGARVVISDLPSQEATAKTTVEEINTNGPGQATWVPLDVTKEDQWEAAVAHAEAVFGPLDVMINNAGVGSESTPLEDKTLDQWRSRIGPNLDGTFLGTKYAIRSMKKNTAVESKSIINVSSIMGLVGGFGGRNSAYAAAKGGVRTFTKSTAIYCASNDFNIRANSVHPGFVETPLSQGVMKAQGTDFDEMIQRTTPLKRVGTPTDIANVFLFLASEESSFITGAEIPVDGGYTAQ
ncbi:VPS35 endosomal protein sorting factor-like [Gonapodya sp. JEL0774]|nr:VPS35 endosomal protein sorting factor-like [Gonapodya sp. JEL0774]